MAVSIQDFWNLASQSQVLTPAQCQQYAASFAQMPGASQSGSAATLAEWLVSQQAVTRYQAKVLMAGRPGPFVYGDYRVYDRFEKGRLNGLFRAVHVASGYGVCLKFLTGPAAQDAQKFAFVSQWAAQAAAVRSPHVARTFHAADQGNYKFIALADLQGETMEQKLAAGPMPPAIASGLARQAAQGLAQLHQVGQVHGEVRPQNVWVDSSGVLKVIGFPLWRDPLSPPTSATAGQTAEMADYMAPEVISGQPPDARSDLYGLGCVLYQMLTGRPPFEGDNVQQKLTRHCGEEPKPPGELNSSVPLPVAQVVGYMMAKDPAKRYQQAANVADALAPYVDPASAQPLQEPVTAQSQNYESWLAQFAAARTSATQTPAQPQAVGPIAVGNVSPVGAQPVAANPQAAGSPGGFAGIQVEGNAAPAAGASSSNPSSSATSTTVTSRRSQRSADRKNRQTMMICGGILAAALIVAALIFLSNSEVDPGGYGGGVTQGNGHGDGNGGPGTRVNSNGGGANGGGNSVNGNSGGNHINPPPEELVIHTLDGDVMRTSPTSGEPLDLRYLPGGAQIFIHLRPAQMMNHPEGKLLLEKTMGDFSGFATTKLTEMFGGLALVDIEEAVIGLMINSPGLPPRAAVVLKARGPVNVGALRKPAGYEYRAVGGGATVVGAPAAANRALGEQKSPFESALSNADANPPLRRELEALLRTTDRQRLLTVLFAPNFLFTGAKALWEGKAQPVKEPIERFIGDNVKAGSFSLHLTSSEPRWLFLELRLYPDGGTAPLVLATETRNKVNELPQTIEQFYVTRSFSPFSKPVLYRFPGMVEAAATKTEAGTSERHAVLRCYLPDYAASSLSYATYLALAEFSGGPVTVAAKKKPQYKTAAEKLANVKLSMVDRNELQLLLKSMEGDLGVEIEIMGKDLESKGVTRNKQTKMEISDPTPAGKVLATMLKTADPTGNLVYVIVNEGGKEKIRITVREKAKERGETVPEQ